jgi:hypothetical protein
MYYADGSGSMQEEDVDDLYGEFRRRGLKRDTKRTLDVLLHTFGGDASTAYRLAQVIRDFADVISFVIPEYAYSGGTLTCLAGDEVLLGACACLSPIDVTLGSSETRGIQLLNIDYYMQFVRDCREGIEKMLKQGRFTGKTDVDSALLVEMVRQVGALNVGRFFRERTMTGHYADRLLSDYMLRDQLNKEHLSEKIIRKLLFEMPSHHFEMDYHILNEINLPVHEMPEQESDIMKELVSMLDDLTSAGVICKDVEKDYKMPFFRLYVGDEIDSGANRKEK